MHEQRRDRSIIWDADADRRYATIIPDILIEPLDSAVPRVAVDAKYKLYDDRAADVSDIMQTFLYAYAYRAASALPRSAVLYPAGDTPSSRRLLQVRSADGLAGAQIDLLPIPIDQVLHEFRNGYGHALTALSEAIGALVFVSAAA